MRKRLIRWLVDRGACVGSMRVYPERLRDVGRARTASRLLSWYAERGGVSVEIDARFWAIVRGEDGDVSRDASSYARERELARRELERDYRVYLAQKGR